MRSRTTVGQHTITLDGSSITVTPCTVVQGKDKRTRSGVGTRFYSSPQKAKKAFRHICETLRSGNHNPTTWLNKWFKGRFSALNGEGNTLPWHFVENNPETVVEG